MNHGVFVDCSGRLAYCMFRFPDVDPFKLLSFHVMFLWTSDKKITMMPMGPQYLNPPSDYLQLSNNFSEPSSQKYTMPSKCVDVS